MRAFLIVITGFALLAILIFYIEGFAGRLSDKNKFKKWWRRNIIGIMEDTEEKK